MHIDDRALDTAKAPSDETNNSRKPYSPPTLSIIGSVEQLTQGTVTPGADVKKIGSI